MATTPTQLPVPSEKPQDLKFNAGKIDEFVTSDSHDYIDRLGGKHRTIAGIDYSANQAMINYGYITKKSFEIGATLDTPNTVLQWESNGEFYRWDGDWSQPKVVDAGSTPDSSGGIGEGKWVGVGDASLRHDLSLTSGSSLISTPTGTVEERLNSLDEDAGNLAGKIVTTIIPCSTPSMGGGVKAIIKKPDSVDDFYVITKKARNQAGFVAIRITNDASPSDSANYGGASPLRLGSVFNCPMAMSAKLIPSSKSAGVTLSTLTAPQIQSIYGYAIGAGGSLNGKTAAGDFNLTSPQVYSIANGENVVYQLKSKKCKVRLGWSNGSATAVTLSISRDGNNYSVVKTVNTVLGPSGASPIGVDTVIDCPDMSGGNWYLRVANTSGSGSGVAYLAGLNFEPLGGYDVYDFDNVIATLLPYTGGESPNYFESNGANEFAAKELATGKFFGTYHGGHSGFQQRLRVEAGSYNLDSGKAPDIFLSRYVLLHSISTLTVGSAATYAYYASTEIGDGATITNYTLKLSSGTPVLCERIYTHMAVTANNFNWIHLPIVLANKTDDGDVSVGQSGVAQQFRASDAVTINCTFSQLNTDSNANGGGYVSFQPNYNKYYYGPTLGSAAGMKVPEGAFTTCKEFF